MIIYHDARALISRLRAIAGLDFRHGHRPVRDLDTCGVMLAQLHDRGQTHADRKAKGRPAPGGPLPLPGNGCRSRAAACALSHPEWFVHFTVRIAARDADVAQRCVA